MSEITELQQGFDQALSARSHEEALGLAMRIQEHHATLHQDALYQVARLNFLLGRRAAGYRWLKAAVDAGFWDVGRLMADETLASEREDSLFREMARGAWSKGYTLLLEREDRDEIQKPDQVLAALNLRRGERVVEIGPGTGYFTVPVAHAIGPEGRLLALDAAQEMLDFLGLRVRAEKLANVVLAKVDREDPHLAPGEADTILMIDTLHYTQDRVGYVRRLLPGLAPGGRIVVIDYFPRSMEERPWGPPPQQQIPRETLDAEMDAAGMEVAESHNFLPEQYFVTYRKRL